MSAGSNGIEQWAAERLQREPMGQTSVTDLANDFNRWRAARGLPQPVTVHRFGQLIRAHGFSVVKRSSMVVLGIALRPTSRRTVTRDA